MYTHSYQSSQCRLYVLSQTTLQEAYIMSIYVCSNPAAVHVLACQLTRSCSCRPPAQIPFFPYLLSRFAAKLRSLTMRLSHLLHTPPAKLALLATSMEDVVFEYGEMGMLLHVAADRSNLEIGVLNLETLKRQEPPEGATQRAPRCGPHRYDLFCIAHFGARKKTHMSCSTWHARANVPCREQLPRLQQHQ